MISRPGRFVVAIAVAGALTTSCASDRGQATASSSLSKPVATPSRAGELRVIDKVIPIRDAEAQFLSTWGHYVAWTGAVKVLTPATRVTVYDVATGRERHVATALPGERLGWVRGDGETVVYVSSRADTDPDGKDVSDWQIHVVDLATGKARVIDRARTRLDKTIEPVPAIGHPWVAWNKAAGGGAVDVIALNLLTGERRTVLGKVGIASLRVLDGRAFYIDGTVCCEQDVFSVPIAGGQKTRLTFTGRVGQASISRAGIAYYEPVQGDPTSVWFLPTGATTPQLVSDSGGSNMVAGDGFVAWAADDAVLARSTSSVGSAVKTLTSDWSTIARLAATGDRLVFAERVLDARGRTAGQKIHLVTLTS